MYCPQCGAEIPDDSRFCEQCGRQLNPQSTAVAGVVVTRPVGKKLTVDGSEHELGGFGRRLAGYLVDGVAVWIGQIVLFVVAAAADVGALLIVTYVASFGYYWVCNSIGVSLGKRAVGLRIINDSGTSPGAGAGLGRTLGAILSWLALMLGYLWATWDDANQTWHDKMTGTYVIRA